VVGVYLVTDVRLVADPRDGRLLIALLPATATVIGVLVLAQIPGPGEVLGVLLVIAGGVLHQERSGTGDAVAATTVRRPC
jgi:threonine/homoserine efflux transporter RhtA